MATRNARVLAGWFGQCNAIHLRFRLTVSILANTRDLIGRAGYKPAVPNIGDPLALITWCSVPHGSGNQPLRSLALWQH